MLFSFIFLHIRMKDFIHIIYFIAQKMFSFLTFWKIYRHMPIVRFPKELETKLYGDANDKNKRNQMTGHGCL